MATTAPTLHRGLKQRHLTMIAIGGVIGAGLFVGSGVVINQTGPGAFITYAFGGLLIVLVMQMLGEMAVARPSTGSFTEYARDALGPWAGFSVAWLYWYFWVIVIGFEAVAGAKILQFWMDVPLWMLSLVLMTLMTLTNLYSVRSFGEFEYWFAGIKVAAIVVFLVSGTLFILGLWPGADLDFSNLTAHGGFLPMGPSVLFIGVVTVIFSMVGAEIATIAAAESENPRSAVTKATRAVVWRISLFFIGSVFLLAVILPWNSTEVGQSPYVSAFERLGIPRAGDLMSAVVLTSVLSCLNSGLYTASRMLFVLAGRREAPPVVLRVNSRGVPTWAILMSTVVGFMSVIAAYFSPTGIFSFLLNSSGAVILFAYILIAASQFVLRRRADAAGTPIVFRMWLFPWLTISSIVAMVAILVSMAVREDTRSQITLGLASWAFLLIVFRAIKGYREKLVTTEAGDEAPSEAHRILVLANDDLDAEALVSRIRSMGDGQPLECHVVVPKNPGDAGATSETRTPTALTRDTLAVSTIRLDRVLRSLRDAGVSAEGTLGDVSPFRALLDGVEQCSPSSVLIIKNPDDDRRLVPDRLLARARHELSVPVFEVAGDPAPPPSVQAATTPEPPPRPVP